MGILGVADLAKLAALCLIGPLLCGCAAAVQAGSAAPSGTSAPSLRTPAADTAEPAATAPAAGVVPWSDAPPPRYVPPPVSIPPAVATHARACSAADVVVRSAQHTGAGGHSVLYLSIASVSPSACLLAGYPKVIAREHGRPDVVATRGSFFPGGRSADMLPGGRTLLGLETDTYCATRPAGAGPADSYHRLLIAVAGGGTLRVEVPADGLTLGCGLRETDFFDPELPRPEPVLPLAGLHASLSLPRSVVRGSSLDFVVTLTNPTSRSITLQPCPAFVEAEISAVPVKQVYALNCSTVRTLAPGVSRRFAMRLALPAAVPVGPLRVTWSLRDVPVLARAVLTVRP